MVYFAASVGIIYDKSNNTQSYYVGHDDDITCLAIDETGKYVATGQRGRVPRVHLWSALTGRLVKRLQPFHRGPIAVLNFSPGKK
jgi:WD40 repeat protein